MIAKARGGLVSSEMVREGRKHSESVRRGSAIGCECRNMRPEPGVAHHRAIRLPHLWHLPVQAVLASIWCR